MFLFVYIETITRRDFYRVLLQNGITIGGLLLKNGGLESERIVITGLF